MTIAANIRAAVTSWWTFDSTMVDAKGVNTLNANLIVSGYSAGKKNNKLNQGSRGSIALAAPIAISTSSGQISLGAWLTYDGINTGPYIMGLQRHLGAGTQEVMAVLNSGGKFTVFGWKNNGINSYGVTQPDVRTTAYPITVQAQDSIGQIATSNQIIRITEPGTNPAGTYFLVTTWDNGTLRLYVNTELVASTVVDAVYTSPIYYFTIGSVGFGSSVCGVDECFLLSTKALSQSEIDYLYNMGAGISYTELQAAP